MAEQALIFGCSRLLLEPLLLAGVRGYLENSRNGLRISRPETTPVYVVPTDEELMIAQHTLSLLWSSHPSSQIRKQAS